MSDSSSTNGRRLASRRPKYVATRILPAGQVQIRTILSDIARGTSRARFIRAVDGNEYLIKGPSLTPEHPHVAGNELIAAELGQRIGLKLLPHAVAVDDDNRYYFASRRLVAGTFYDGLFEQLLARCTNRDSVHRIVVFDAWLINDDRTAPNFLVNKIKGKGTKGERLDLIPIDHGHCLARKHRPPEQLQDALGTTPGRYVPLDFVRAAIVSAQLLRNALDAVERVRDDEIRRIVRGVPAQLLPDASRPYYEDFLLARQRELRHIFDEFGWHFRNLGGAVA